MTKDNWSLEGKKAIVTGGTKGIGKAVAEALCEFGAETLIVSRNEADLLAVKKEFIEKGFNCQIFRADLSVKAERDGLIRFTRELWSSLDILVNNTGTNIRKKAHEYLPEEYNHIFSTNLDSAYALSVGFHELLTVPGHASIVNISSVAGLGHMRTGIVYGMTKAAMLQMTKNLAVEWAPSGIRVNAIAPWYIRTPLAKQVLSNKSYMDEVLQRTPMNRIGEPGDVASLAVFLCLSAAKYITGQCIAVDGGMSVNLF